MIEKQTYLNIRRYGSTSGEDMYNNFWADTCINPLEMVKLMHSDLYHDQCVHDGEDLPLCSELAARVDDDWCFDNDNSVPSSDSGWVSPI